MESANPTLEGLQPLIAHPEDLRSEHQPQAERVGLDFFDDVWARGNVDHADHYLAEKFCHHAPPGYAPDREGYKQMVTDFHKAFPDATADFTEYVGTEDKFAGHWLMEGTHEGTWMGVPGTGKHVRMEGLVFANLKNGKIESEYVVDNAMEWLPQVGVTDLSALQGPQK